MRSNRAEVLNQAPLDDLLALLLRQFRALLQARGIDLSESERHALALRLSEQSPLTPGDAAVRDALIDIVTESETVLAQWDLSFAQSIRTEMGDMSNWETTAEFLEVANQKGNAEMRIAAASALVMALGDSRFAEHLITAYEHDPDELDGVIARRVLLRVTGLPETPDWVAQVRGWLRG